MSSVIRIASYNIRRAINVDNIKDINGIGDTLQEINADIIALQEVEMIPGVGKQSKQAHVLAKRLGMNYVYGPVRKYKLGSIGNAVLSRYKVSTDINHELPDSRDNRCCLQVDIDIGNTLLRFFSLHLGLNQVSRYRHLKYIILPLVQESEFPCIISGDMNATPRMREIRMLSEYMTDTFQQNTGMLGHTFPSDAPRVRIDYIFQDDKSKCYRFNIVKSLASDHLPVLAEIKIEKM